MHVCMYVYTYQASVPPPAPLHSSIPQGKWLVKGGVSDSFCCLAPRTCACACASPPERMHACVMRTYARKIMCVCVCVCVYVQARESVCVCVLCVCVCVVCVSRTSDAWVGAQGRDGGSVCVPTGLSPRALPSVAPCSTSPRPRAQERPWEESLKSQCPISFTIQGKCKWNFSDFLPLASSPLLAVTLVVVCSFSALREAI